MNAMTVITVKTYTPEEMDAIGKRLAMELGLRHDSEHEGRWCTGWGSKTNTGLFLTLREMMRRIDAGESI